MKKNILFFGLLALCGCNMSEPFEWWDGRRTFVEQFSTYAIDSFQQGEQLVNTELVTEKNYESNELLEARVGESMISEKIYKVKHYSTNLVRANMPGFMHSASVPGRIPANRPMDVVGSIQIKGKIYRLIPSELEDFVYLIKEDGSFFDEMGQIRDGRLAILDATFVPSPENLRMLPVAMTRQEQGKPVAGFDLKYKGVEVDHIFFDYYDYEKGAKNPEDLIEEVNVSMKRQIVELNGIKFKIFNANNYKIEYMILDD